MIKGCYAVGPLDLRRHVSSCSSSTHDSARAPQTVASAALDSLLLSASEVDAALCRSRLVRQLKTGLR
jgi:hypothetical protein